MKLPLTIIIPARHEEEAILKTLKEVARQVKTPHRVIVVNDLVDATDQTAQLVKLYQRTHPNVSLVIYRHQDKRGFAATLYQGLRKVKSGIVVFVMADLCDQPPTIDIMYQKIRAGYDVACGSRYMRGGRKIGGPRLQGFFSWWVNHTLYYLVGIPTHDSSNSFKMYRAQLLRQLVWNKNQGVECSLQLILQAYFRGAKIGEVPTVWHGRSLGTSKFNLWQRAPGYIKIYIWAVYEKYRRLLP